MTGSSRALTFILITVLIDVMGFGIIIPVMPRLLAQLQHTDVASAAATGGWLAFAFALAAFFCSPVVGNLSDRFGRRPVLLASLAALGIEYVVLALAPNLTWLFIARILSGACSATYPTAMAYITDVTAPEKRAKAFGVMGAAFGLGFILGPLAGGLFGALGPRAPFWFAAALSLTNVLFGALALPESLAHENRRTFSWKRANPLGTVLSLRRYPIVAGLLLAIFPYYLAFQALPATWAFHAIVRYGWTATAVGFSLAFSGLMIALVQGVLVGKVVGRLGERRAVVIGLAAGALGFLGYTFSPNGWVMMAVLILWSLCGFTGPAMNAILSHAVRADEQGELQGALMSLQSVAAIFGPVLMTALFSAYARPGAPVFFPGAAWAAAATLTVVSLSLVLLVMRRVPVVVTAEPSPAAAT